MTITELQHQYAGHPNVEALNKLLGSPQSDISIAAAYMLPLLPYSLRRWLKRVLARLFLY